MKLLKLIQKWWVFSLLALTHTITSFRVAINLFIRYFRPLVLPSYSGDIYFMNGTENTSNSQIYKCVYMLIDARARSSRILCNISHNNWKPFQTVIQCCGMPRYVDPVARNNPGPYFILVRSGYETVIIETIINNMHQNP